MQYILSQEEMNQIEDMKSDLKILSAMFAKHHKLQEICTKAANEWPIKYWGREEASPWGCVLTDEYVHYCDECPVQDICPSDRKSWSK